MYIKHINESFLEVFMELTSTGVIVLKKATQVQEFAISDVEHFADIYIFNCPALKWQL